MATFQTRVMAAGLLALAAVPCAAEDYCARNAVELVQALQAAAASPADDLIRIGTAGPVVLSAEVSLQVRGALEVRGGFGSTCTISLGSAMSRIDGEAAKLALEMLDGDLTLSRLVLEDFDQVRVDGADSSPGGAAGTLRVQRVAVRDGRLGLVVYPGHHDVRIENSIFSGASAPVGNIFTGVGVLVRPTADRASRIELVNNTSVGNTIGITIGGNSQANDDVRLDNNISYGNVGSDLILRQGAIARFNLWDVVNIAGGGGFDFGTLDNRDTDPLLDAGFLPAAGSPAVNSGTGAPAGGLPSADHDGGPRLVGTRPDRGALETSINDAATLTVTSAANSGPGTLRQALQDANSHPAVSAIEFDIPGACPAVIALTTALPAATTPVRILGYSQPGSDENDDLLGGFSATLCIVLRNAGSLDTGLHLDVPAGAQSHLEGLSFYGFDSEALLVSGDGAASVRGNGFGCGASNLFGDEVFADAALRIQDAPGSLVGGPELGDRNCIARAAQAGVRLEAAEAGRTLRGNLIGSSGNGANANGVHVEGSTGDLLENNWIGYSSSHGVVIEGGTTPARSVVLRGNRLGDGVFLPTPNGGNGVRIRGGEGHVLEQNRIANNGTDGVAILAAARRVQLLGNRIYRNALLAVDMSPDGVNPVDLDVGAAGANDGINRAELFSAEGGPTQGHVAGQLRSSNGSYVVQVFRNNECDESGYGEAQYPVGSASFSISDATPAANGMGFFLVQVDDPDGDLEDSSIAAIVTRSDGNSSETSFCIPYLPGPHLFRDGFE